MANEMDFIHLYDLLKRAAELPGVSNEAKSSAAQFVALVESFWNGNLTDQEFCFNLAVRAEEWIDHLER